MLGTHCLIRCQWNGYSIDVSKSKCRKFIALYAGKSQYVNETQWINQIFKHIHVSAPNKGFSRENVCEQITVVASVLFLTGWKSGKILFSQSLLSVACHSCGHLIIGNGCSFSFSEMEDCCHVLEENGDVYSATLGLVDIVRGTNSYYKLQLLKEDKAHG